MNSVSPSSLGSLQAIISKQLSHSALVVLGFFSLFSAITVAAQQLQTEAPRTSAQTVIGTSRITESVDDDDRILLKGNTHPLAIAALDQGAAPPSLPMMRMLLVLKRSPEQEAALQELLEKQQERTSPNYHKWLTPGEFGRQFGPSDSDIQALTSWLGSKGFNVAKVANGRNVIEFSGSAAQVQEAFRTEIHKFALDGEQRWANASDPQIPAALAPVVHGLLSLHNFPRKPISHRVGPFAGSITAAGATVSPFFTVSNGTRFAVGPSDFAKIYNVQSLWDSAITGSGQSIAVVGESNINIQDVRNFRSLLALLTSSLQL